MRIRITGPTSVLLLGTALACAAADGEAEPTRAQARVDESCARCHPGAQLDAVVAKHVGDRDPSAALDAFLAEHHVPDAALRAEVVALLVARLAER